MNRIILYTLFVSLLGSIPLFGQIDPRITSVLSRLTPEQKQMLASSAGMLGKSSQPRTIAETKEQQEVDSQSDSSNADEIKEEKEEVNILEELLFLEQLLLNDLVALKARELDQSNEVNSANDELRMIESIEQTKRLLFEIKQKQRDEIERRSQGLLVEYDEDELKPFGLEFFTDLSEHEMDDMSLVPTDYLVGPGDVLEILLFGQKNEAFNLLVNRDGILHFPNIGPINVFEQGRDFIDLKNTINQKIKEHLGKGVQSSITLGALRSIQVFVLGQVKSPGSHLLAPHSCITTALRAAGGITEKGSMRQIYLKRKGKAQSELDLYNLLLNGDSSNDKGLKAGDVVFVPAVGPQVSISGEVQVPAIYELTGNTSLDAAINLAGGITQDGFSKLVTLKRRNDYGRYDLLTFNLATDKDVGIKGGDFIEVAKAENRFVQAVEIFGPVERPGAYQWKKGMSLKNLFAEFGSFLDVADLRFGYIIRQNEFREISVIHFYPRSIIKGEQNIELFQDDRIFVLSSESMSDRMKDIRRIVLDLKKHTPNGVQAKFVAVAGEVHFPGEYPLSEGMTARDLVLASGGLTDAAYSLGAELTRLGLDNQKFATVEHIRVDTNFFRDSNSSATFKLLPYDSLAIKPIPSWRAGEMIEISGEVNFPGNYAIRPGEKLADIIARAGGLTDRAFPEGAVFTRKSLAEKETEQRERLISRLEADLAEASLQALNSQEASRSETAADSMLKRLQNTESVGRLVIDLSDILSNKKTSFTVKDGDKLHVPDLPSSVSVAGEVQFPTAHLYDSKLDMEDYLNRSGGFTQNADKERVFVVKANGGVQAKSANKWFGNSGNSFSEINPGDVIVVPIDVKQSRILEQLSYTSQIIYQMAVTAAAVNSF